MESTIASVAIGNSGLGGFGVIGMFFNARLGGILTHTILSVKYIVLCLHMSFGILFLRLRRHYF